MCSEGRKTVTRNTESKFVFPVSVLITLLCVLLCIVAYSRQCAENKGSGKCVWLCGRAASLHLCLSPSLIFFLRFCSPLLVLLSGQGCHTTERHHKEGRKKKSLCSQPARGSNRWEVKQNRGRKAYFLPSFGKQKPLLWWRRGFN